MKVEVCKTAGFCAGIRNAIKKLDESIENNEEIIMYKPILHNKCVLNKYAQKGIFVETEISNLSNKKILIRAHGEKKETFEYMDKNNISYIDCTCVNVKRIHSLVKEYNNKGYKIIVIGNYKTKLHPEVEGIISYADSPILIEDLEDTLKLKDSKFEKYFAVCQTTLVDEKVDSILEEIIKILENKIFEYKKTTCAHQKNNIKHSKELCDKSDIAIVLGDKMSNNTKELYSECEKICKCYFAENIEDIKNLIKTLDKNLTVALLAGASTDIEDLELAKEIISNY